MNSVRKKVWGGYVIHPIIECMSPKMVEMGYVFNGFDDDYSSSGAEWSMDIFPGFSMIVRLHGNAPIQVGSVLMRVVFNVESSYVQDIMNIVEGLGSKVNGTHRALVGWINFPRLLQFMDPCIVGVGSVWAELKESNMETAIYNIERGLANQGRAVIDKISTPRGLIGALMKPEVVFPKEVLREPFSREPVIMAALIEMYLGNFLEAKRLLSEERSRLEGMSSSKKISRIDKYLDFVEVSQLSVKT